MPEYCHTSEHREGCTGAKTGADDLKDAKSEIHCKVQNVLMPGSSEAALQSPGPVLQTLEQTTDELEMREREKERKST